MWIAANPAEGKGFAGGIFQFVVDEIRREDARQDGAQRAARAVDAESVESVVVAEAVLNGRDHKEAENAGEKTDQQSGERLHKTGAGVMATKPATAPEMPPSMLGLPCRTHSANIQPRPAAAAAK